ncbi:hypothetical protein Dda_2215 [Drechslerella dactyloides]|uniref:Uncharacterized protein n=1 Tax=Drechslerella dactyloides TaxID=74499 RepID=A0AAD6NMF7_DREDA|nr:hypothetical protein Dda_2215 [Drechslerella dactyloides]
MKFTIFTILALSHLAVAIPLADSPVAARDLSVSAGSLEQRSAHIIQAREPKRRGSSGGSGDDEEDEDNNNSGNSTAAGSSGSGAPLSLHFNAVLAAGASFVAAAALAL